MLTLEDISEVRIGHPFRGAVPIEPLGSERIVQSRDLAEGEALQAGELARTDATMDERARLVEGDIVLQTRGNRFPAVLIGPATAGAFIVAPLYLVRPDPEKVLPAYLVFILNGGPVQAQLREDATGSHIPQVPATAIRALCLPIPPLADQHAIASCAALAEEEHRLAASLAAHRTAWLNALALAKDQGQAKRKSREHANAPG